MSALRVVHTADVHFDGRHPEPALRSLETLRDYVAGESVDLVIIAGDLHHRPVVAAESQRLPALIGVLREILARVPILAVYGTPSHDAPGSYEPYRGLDTQYQLTAIGPGDAGTPLVLTSGGRLVDPRDSDSRDAIAMVTGFPEPTRGWLLAEREGLGRAEATDQVLGSLRRMLLGVAAVRRGYPELPSVLAYHGEITGARAATGQTLPPGGIALSRDDLALAGADYVALGHLHLRQQVANLPAWYSGSAYPVDWGETDRKSFAVVDLEGPGAPPSIEVVSYPHPPRKKLVVDSREAITASGTLLYGHEVWAVIRHAPAKRPDLQAIEATIKAAGAAGVRVTAEPIPRETVRVGQIAELADWGAKLRAWGESSGVPVTPALEELARGVQSGLRDSGHLPAPRRWRLQELKLRGAVGIWKGTGRDEIKLDFGAFQPGLIALSGPNGAGKTTLVENLHPWPGLMTRSGPLQEHFRLRDSYRDLTVVDELSGETYRCLIQIDAYTDRREHRVYRDGVPLGADGSTAAYTAEVDRLFGSQGLYLLSVCATQRPVMIRLRTETGDAVTATTDLSSASRSMRRAILRELIGLQAYAAAAREAAARSKAELAEVDRLSGEIDRLSVVAAKLPAVQRTLDGICARENAGQVRLREYEGASAAAAEELERVRERQAESEAAKAEIERLDTELRDLDAKQAILRLECRQFLSWQASREEAERVLHQGKELEQRRRTLMAAESQVQQQRHRVLTVQRDKERAYRERQAALDRQISATRIGIGELQAREPALKASLAEVVRRLATAETHCGECGRPLPQELLTRAAEGRKRATVERLQHENSLAELASVISVRRDELRRLEAQCEALAAPPEPDLPESLMSKIDRCNAALRESDIEAARSCIAEAARADGEVAGRKRQLRDLAERANEFRSRRREFTIQVDPRLSSRLAQAQNAVAAAERSLTAVRTELAELRAHREHTMSEVEQLRQASAELAAARSARQLHEDAASDWGVVADGLGPDGIQSLEIEAAAPAVAEAANRLLAASYGDRWRIRFVLQRPSGTGARRKMVEDVQIVVYDAEHADEPSDSDLEPGEQLLETLSGGETVWIQAALAGAFAAVREQSTGLQYRTACLDEADGALDPEAKDAYYALLEAAHTEAGRSQTVVITHAADQQQSIGQVIELTPDAGAPPLEAVHG